MNVRQARKEYSMAGNIKNVTLSGTEVQAVIHGRFCNIRNLGADIIYASAAPLIVPDSDRVLPIPAGESAVLPGCGGKVFLLGTGKAVLIGDDEGRNFFKPAAGGNSGGADNVARNAISAHSADLSVHFSAGSISCPNLLINPWFVNPVNQRKASGVISQEGYFIDRWKLVSGSVEVTSAGLLLNGTIAQILEYPAGEDVTASSSAGTASYDNSTQTFTLTANGVLVEWAKLEAGGCATAFSPPDAASELEKCRRYYCRIDTENRQWAHYGTGIATSDTRVFTILQLPTAMRSGRNVEWGGSISVYSPIDGSGTSVRHSVTDITATGASVDTDFSICLDITSSGLTLGAINLISNHKDATAYIAINAEL